jgi:pimeloyl-ACP methyl ester carboxylesterase
MLAALLPVQASAQAALEGRFLDSDGTRIHYMDQGSGEPVLLIHGLTLDIETGWLQPGIVAALRNQGYRVVAYDTRGHGKSDRPHDPAAYGPSETEDAIRLLDHLGIDRAHVVGWSRGGFLANRIAARHPERVQTLTLGGWGESGQNDGAIPEPGRSQTAAILEAGDFHTMVRIVIPDGSESEVEEWATLLAERNDPRALAAAVRAGASWPLLSEDELRANQTAALAIVGDRDFLSAEVEKMSAVMSHLEVLVLPGATHGTTLSRPEFVTALIGFLRKHREE